MTNMITKIFKERLDNLLSSVQGKTLLFFKGFALPQIKELVMHSNSILSDINLFNDSGLDICALNDKWFDLIKAIKETDKPLVGFYEELLILQDFLSHIKVDKILIIENNFLTPWQPSLLSKESTLALFDFLQQETEPKSELLRHLVQIYGDVKILDDGNSMVLPIIIEENYIETVPFWSSSSAGDKYGDEYKEEYKRIEIGTSQDWEYRLRLLSGDMTPAIFVQPNEGATDRQQGLASALTELGVPFVFDIAQPYTKRFVYDETQFCPLLKQFWGNDAQFRSLRFYKNPDLSLEQEEISQGQIIAEIVDQCELAQLGESYSNVFITAPTGSGKSILFQLPALYLAEKYGCVTIVVSPLIALMNDQVEQLKNENVFQMSLALIHQ